MFLLSAKKNSLTKLEGEPLTSGSVNVYQVKIQFDDAWDGLDRMAVFKVGEELVSAPLDEDFCCTIPWEVLQRNDIDKRLELGVYGVKDGNVVLPTVWTVLGTILEGTRPGPNTVPPTPSLAEQVLGQISADRRAAEDAAERAEEAAKRAEDAAGGGGAGGTGNVSSQEIQIIKVLDRAEYDALAEKSPQTLYLIRG